MSLTAAVCAASMTALQENRLEALSHLSSVTHASWELTPFTRHQWYMMFFDDGPWGLHMQRWMADSIHDLFIVAFIPAILLALWLGLVVVPSNARAREMRLGPLRPQPAEAPAQH